MYCRYAHCKLSSASVGSSILLLGRRVHPKSNGRVSKRLGYSVPRSTKHFWANVLAGLTIYIIITIPGSSDHSKFVGGIGVKQVRMDDTLRGQTVYTTPVDITCA